jgi:hypothetical protein
MSDVGLVARCFFLPLDMRCIACTILHISFLFSFFFSFFFVFRFSFFLPHSNQHCITLISPHPICFRRSGIYSAAAAHTHLHTYTYLHTYTFFKRKKALVVVVWVLLCNIPIYKNTKYIIKCTVMTRETVD